MNPPDTMRSRTETTSPGESKETSPDAPQAASAKAHAKTHATKPASEVLCDLWVEKGVLAPNQVKHATRVRDRLSSHKSLADVVKELGYAKHSELEGALSGVKIELPFYEVMLEMGHLRAADIKSVMSLQERAPDKSVADLIVENHFANEESVATARACEVGCELLHFDYSDVDQRLLKVDDLKMFEQHRFVPVKREGGEIVVAFWMPDDKECLNAAKRMFGHNIHVTLATWGAISQSIRTHKRNQIKTAAGSESSVVRIVDEIIETAVREGVSDIHIEPMQDSIRVRYRKDGVLIPHETFPKEIGLSLSSRLKIVAGADIAERRRHQDGRMVVMDPVSGQEVDLRVSFYVTVHGEKCVMRILSRGTNLLSIRNIGMGPRVLERLYRDVLDIPSGVALITGPTGSGKTTTLYGCINHLNDIERSIITAEDPVEYMIEGVGQCSLDPKVERTFATSLPHIVRQDPDVIVLGEIRDQSSAEAAIHAALTGHKVITTLHTEDTIGGLLRLINMEIDTFLISSTVVSVLAQRLVRRVCSSCAEPYTPTSAELSQLGLLGGADRGFKFVEGRGCGQCRNTGYRGRVGVFELLVLNDFVKDAILSRKPSYEIRRICMDSSRLVTLLEDGLLKATLGETTVHEVLRHLPRLDKPRPLGEIRRLTGL